MAKGEKINNPKKPRSEEMKGIPMVTLFDLHTGGSFDYPLEQHEIFVKSNSKLAKKGTHSEYYKRHYVIQDFPGDTYPGLFHVKSGKPLTISTSLFEEIKKRNPTNPNIKEDGSDNLFDPVKKYIVSAADIKKAKEAKKASAAPKDELAAMRAELAELKALLKGDNKTKHKEAEPETEKGEAPKEGRVTRPPKEK